MLLPILIAFAVVSPSHGVWADQGGAKKNNTPVQAGLPPYFGPRKRAIVAGIDVKVQAVTTTVPTPSGNTSVISLDLQQPTEFGTGLTDMLVTALVESKRFVVLERQNLEEITRERALNEDPSKPVKTLGAQVIIRGAVTELSFKRSGGGANLVSEVLDGTVVRSVATVALDLKIVDVESGRVLDSVRAEGRVGSSLTALNLKKDDIKFGVASFENGPLGRAVRSAINDGIRKICERTEKIPWQARVAAVIDEDDGKKLYLNTGVGSGLQEGDLLEVTRLGEEIRDPDTQVLIGRTKGKRIGRCRVVALEEAMTIAVPIDGTDFQREDVVRFVERKGA
jgi:curli biogenesis system outer membrane secretion channel CsgG